MLPRAQDGVGSPVSVVAPELSFVSVNEFAEMAMALAKLSLAGGGATTVNFGNVTVAVVRVVPPPGGGVYTPAEFVLPKLARKLAGMVAERCSASVNVVGMRTLPFGWPLPGRKSGLSMTCELVAKFVPVTVIAVLGEFTGMLARLTLEITGGPERMLNVSGLLLAVPTETET